MEIRWVFGGVRGGFQTDWAGAGGWTGGLHAGDAAGNHLEIHGSAAVLHSPDVPERSVAVAASAGSAPGNDGGWLARYSLCRGWR